MNRYTDQADLNDQQSESQKFEQSQNSMEQIVPEQQIEQLLPSVKKYLSNPNPLMNKIQFSPYHPKCYYPKNLSRLPICLRDFNCQMIQKNNMNSLLEANHAHYQLKNDVINLLTDRKTNKDYTHLGKQPVYSRYQQNQLKLDLNKNKLRYFATYVLDMAKLLKKQLKLQQNKVTTLPKTDNTVINRAGSVSRSGNFTIREPRSSLIDKPSTCPTQRKLLCSEIQFDSNFQSGNLYRVYQKQYNQYDLILQNDINTKGNTQWFFFSVRNVPKNSNLKLNLVNMSKKTSLFNIGMKPYIFSMVKYQKRNIGWVRDGSKISYEQSSTLRKQSSASPYYKLSFEYKFIYDCDIVYFAYSIPYTLNDLSSYLNKTLSNSSLHKIVKLKQVGYTLGSNQVDLIEITNQNTANKNKKAVWILSRQHPGQTTSGFMLEGIINYLIADNQQANILLNNFIFKIVPMMNIDGVVHGNSRAELTGADTNRKWASPNKHHNPIIHSIKHFVQKDKDKIQMVIDLHSHSRKLGTFFYGNTMPYNKTSSKIYPLIVCKKDERFTFKSCRFRGGNTNTARYSLFQSLKIPLIYTVQSSFYGYQTKDHSINAYYPKDYIEMGSSLMISFFEFELKNNFKSFRLQKSFNQNQNVISYVQQQMLLNQQGQDDDGSDSQPDQDEYTQKQYKKLFKQKNEKKKKKYKKKLQVQTKLKAVKQVAVVIPLRPKTNNSQSFYKDLFSGRLSCAKTPLTQLCHAKPKVSFTIGIQVNLQQRQSLNGLTNKKGIGQRQTNVLMEKNTIGVRIGKKIPNINGLCVVGQKVEEITVYGCNVGLQASDNREIFVNKAQFQTHLTNRKSFSVRTRAASFLQVKQNNFLQRADCLTKNLFSKK